MEIMKKLWRSVVFKNSEIVRFTSMITSQSHAVPWRSAEERRQRSETKGVFTHCTAESRSCTFTAVPVPCKSHGTTQGRAQLEAAYAVGFNS